MRNREKTERAVCVITLSQGDVTVRQLDGGSGGGGSSEWLVLSPTSDGPRDTDWIRNNMPEECRASTHLLDVTAQYAVLEPTLFPSFRMGKQDRPWTTLGNQTNQCRYPQVLGVMGPTSPSVLASSSSWSEQQVRKRLQFFFFQSCS